MSWETDVVEGLMDANIDLVTQLPDGALGPVVDALDAAGVRTLRVELSSTKSAQ